MAQGIIVNNLCLHKGHVHPPELPSITHNLSFTVAPNTIMGIIGASGCGKSLTCLALMGLIPSGIVQHSGTISVDGRPVLGIEPLSWLRGKTIAMIMQNPASCFDPLCSIEAHFADTLAAHNLPCSRQHIEDCLSEVGFNDAPRVRRLYPDAMSGGMLQRVMIALAVALKAPYLLADEPTTDLDPVSQKHILELLLDIRKRRGVGILLVSHDLSVMQHVADTIAVMHEGRLVEQGTMADFMRQPQSSHGRELLQAHRQLSQPWCSLPTTRGTQSQATTQNILAPLSGQATTRIKDQSHDSPTA